ncbi:myb-related protein MYBAS1-like protein [Carex littledalei]|uniref:Myb-related protein MYBAS1-like protein n=1 Tax=Carex littledalei TaxID=544730 RepID=A0A833QP11_9POAL|nr:myb-related protein MYBAS1-like protein [Carex littledalei]
MVTMMGGEETRKGPWTEQEDSQLVCFVRLFGERRWDFIARVSGLNRTGKSCRLRWVNYLHPGLKHGRMTPQEERLILELHSKWGNRWSRIARRLPGRTDNEIKNYWRTHMRKKAQERKRSTSPSSSSSSLTYENSPTSNPPPVLAGAENWDHIQNSIPCRITSVASKEMNHDPGAMHAYPMEQIWRDIEKSEAKVAAPQCGPCQGNQIGTVSNWDYCYAESLLRMENELKKLFLPPVQIGGLFC